MKILLINHYAGGPKYGMEFRPLYLAREWVKKDHEVVVVAADYSHVRAHNPNLRYEGYKKIEGLDYNIFKSESIDGVKFIWCRTPSYVGNGLGRVLNIFVFLLRLFQMSSWLKKHYQADQIITSSTYPMDIFPARWIQKKLGRAKLIFEVHDLWPLSPMELGGMSKWNPFIMWVQLAEDLSYKWASKVVSILPKTKEHMISRGMESKKFYHIPNAIHFDEWDAEINRDHNKLFENEMSEIKSQFSLTVAYFGTHGLANALSYFIDAAAEAQAQNLSIAFILVGSGPEKENLKQRTLEKRISNVYFMPPISKTEIPNAMKLADVLYIGLQNQALFRFGISPNKLIDYMAAAKPILFAVESGNNPVLEANCGYSVKAEDTKAIIAGLKKIQNLNQAEREQLGKNGLVYARQNHDYKVLAEKFINEIFLN